MRYLFILVLVMGTVLAIGEGNKSLAVPDLHGEVLWRLLTDKDYQGPVQRAAVDREGKVTYLATMATLYEVQNGKVEPISRRPEKEARLALAPGGGAYAWLLPHPSGHGLFYVRIFDISGKKIAELSLKDYGFNTLHFDHKEKLLVTASPLDDWNGIRGRFQFNFWSWRSETVRKVVLDGRRVGIPDPAGETILLLGKEDAVAFSASGKQGRPFPGKYRKAAVAKEGKLALLNPSSPRETREVHIFRDIAKTEGEPVPVKAEIPTPVHDLILTPDGSSAVVVGDRGRYFLLDPSTGNFREGTRLPFEGTFYITNLKYVDANTLAMGVLHREGEPPKVTWPKGTILVIDLKGKVIFKEDLLIQRASAGEPHIDVAYGSRFIVGYTKEKTMLIELKQ
jgi:hypothetical protein